LIDDLRVFRKCIGNPLSDICNMPMILDWTQGALAEGLRCYRAGEFFAAHEHWESVWLHAPEPEKTLLQALIQLAAAFHHLGRHNLNGARLMLQAALKRLAPYPDSFQGVSVASLSDEIRQCLCEVENQGAAVRLASPSIQIADRQS
jgi:predicted metal-dependent hydrolase